jgi:N-acetylglucosaminyl-diphospho-decaprenol L-rhamnosyltransferase
MELSYGVINTNGGDFVLDCLEAIRRTHPAGTEHEIVMVENASDDGSPDAVRRRFPEVRLIARDRRAGISANLNLLLRETRGRLFLFLNEDAELQDGATQALIRALEADPRAAAAGAMLLDAERRPTPCAWRLPGIGSALASALFLHRWLLNQSEGEDTKAVGWARSAAFLLRRAACEEVGGYDTDFFFYAEETDIQKRLHDAGWRILYVPAARVLHHQQADTAGPASVRRVVQFHRSRDLYMRKHHSRAAAAMCRVLWAWSYVPRAIAAVFMPGHDARVWWLHARRALRPSHGEGMREAAEAYNLQLAAARTRDPASDQTPPRSSSRAATS